MIMINLYLVGRKNYAIDYQRSRFIDRHIFFFLFLTLLVLKLGEFGENDMANCSVLAYRNARFWLQKFYKGFESLWNYSA